VNDTPMNKRIKELADQCMIEVKNVPCIGIDGWTTLETVRQIDPEKFAELIIEEINKINYEVDFLHTSEKVSLENKYRVHFGVK
jgi:hypothetical protein